MEMQQTFLQIYLYDASDQIDALLHDLYYGCYPVFGKMSTLIYVVEWQKRGPPHAHILAICNCGSNPWGPEDYDKIVCAEIPNSKTHPRVHAVVTKVHDAWSMWGC